MNATHRVSRFSSVISFLTQFSGNLQLDTSQRKEPYGDKGNIHRWKLERRFFRNLLVVCEFFSQSYTNLSWSSQLTQSLRTLRRASLDHTEAYADKGNFIRSKRERRFLRNFFLISEFTSESSNLDLRKQFANPLLVESAKWYLGVHMGTWGKIKYPHIITREKLFEKLHCHVWMQLTDLHFSIQWSVCSHSFLEICH